MTTELLFTRTMNMNFRFAGQSGLFWWRAFQGKGFPWSAFRDC